MIYPLYSVVFCICTNWYTLPQTLHQRHLILDHTQVDLVICSKLAIFTDVALVGCIHALLCHINDCFHFIKFLLQFKISMNLPNWILSTPPPRFSQLMKTGSIENLAGIREDRWDGWDGCWDGWNGWDGWWAENCFCFSNHSGCDGNWSREQLTDCFSGSEKYNRCHFISNYIENWDILQLIHKSNFKRCPNY